MGRPVWTSTMLGLQLSPILLLLAVSLTSAQNDKCVTEDNEDCRCIFPFKYEGVSYTECTDVDSDSLWCATSLDDDGEYLTYGFCKENEAAEVDVCAGQCQKANEECRVEDGKAVCRCLDGYIDENNDGNCKCVRDWVSGGTRGDICNTCPRGFQLKTWQHKTTKKRKQWCHREATECNPDSGELNENYPNVQRIGQGYNILIGNLLELPALDSLGHNGFRELHKRIFNPYSVNYDDSRDDCKINGYILDKSRNCRATLKTTVFSNSNQVIEKIAEKVKTGETVEEFTFSVSEGENAQFSNSVSFGQSADSTTGSSSNHCVDESVSQSTETGKTVEKSSSTEASKSFEETQSNSTNTEKSESDTKTSSSSKEQSSSSTLEISATVSASASFAGFSASASASTSSSNTKSSSSTTSNENSKTGTFTEGSTSESGYTRSESNSKSSSNSDSFTNTASNQKSISTNICSEGSQSSTTTAGKESTKDQNNEYNTGNTFEKSFEIPGDARSVSHSAASCMKFSARLNDNSPP